MHITIRRSPGNTTSRNRTFSKPPNPTISAPKRSYRCVTKLQSGKEVSDEGAARRIVINALNAFVEWHRSPAAGQLDDDKKAEVAKVYEAIDRLRQTENTQLRVEVEKAREALGRKA